MKSAGPGRLGWEREGAEDAEGAEDLMQTATSAAGVGEDEQVSARKGGFVTFFWGPTWV